MPPENPACSQEIGCHSKLASALASTARLFAYSRVHVLYLPDLPKRGYDRLVPEEV
jgi:hypothetical protein